MNNRELNQQLQRLHSLFQRANEACGEDMEMRSHWAKYLCVLCSGFLENALGEVFSTYCGKVANVPVATYAGRNLKKIQNPKTAKFIEITGVFKKSWGEQLAAFVNENGRKEAIDAIMANRHLIAHGKRSDISIVRVTEYFKKSLEVIEFIERQCAG